VATCAIDNVASLLADGVPAMRTTSAPHGAAPWAPFTVAQAIAQARMWHKIGDVICWRTLRPILRSSHTEYPSLPRSDRRRLASSRESTRAIQ